ncbi:hypothetical protein FRC10_004157 [Ceratobasidium sp. 414]|nr:hypothetical protein FRC10_004157 [Ceratobasidium sp. 414]
MGKIRQTKCPYCRKAFKRPSGLERHFVQKVRCGRQRLDDLNGHTSTGARPDANAVPELMPPGALLGAHGSEATGNKGQQADVQIAEASSPRQFPPVTLEEMEDEDAPHFPQWGPHPFAKPTRASLFPEPHPDPTAGIASVFHSIDEQPPPLYNTVLADPDVFREAYWLANLPISCEDESAYFDLPRTRGWHWKNAHEFKEEIDRLPHGPDWYRQTIRVPGDVGDEVVDLWKRDIREMVRYLIRDRRFMEYMRFAPERHWDSAEMQNQVYGEMWSADWWWRIQTEPASEWFNCGANHSLKR